MLINRPQRPCKQENLTTRWIDVQTPTLHELARHDVELCGHTHCVFSNGDDVVDVGCQAGQSLIVQPPRVSRSLSLCRLHGGLHGDSSQGHGASCARQRAVRPADDLDGAVAVLDPDHRKELRSQEGSQKSHRSSATFGPVQDPPDVDRVVVLLDVHLGSGTARAAVHELLLRQYATVRDVHDLCAWNSTSKADRCQLDLFTDPLVELRRHDGVCDLQPGGQRRDDPHLARSWMRRRFSTQASRDDHSGHGGGVAEGLGEQLTYLSWTQSCK